MPPVTSDRPRIATRRKQGRRALVASMAASVAIHVFVLSLGINPPAATNGRVETAPAAPDFPSAIRISGIAGADPAAALGARLSDPLLWRDIRDVFADSAFTSVEPLSRRVDRGGSGNTPTDAWAFSTWTTRDAEGRLWGAAPGVIYIAGFAISTCGGRFDASNCGFGLPPSRRGEYQQFLRAWIEIEQQKLRGCIMERAQMMRERREGKGDTVAPKTSRCQSGYWRSWTRRRCGKDSRGPGYWLARRSATCKAGRTAGRAGAARLPFMPLCACHSRRCILIWAVKVK